MTAQGREAFAGGSIPQLGKMAFACGKDGVATRRDFGAGEEEFVTARFGPPPRAATPLQKCERPATRVKDESPVR